MEQVKEDWHLDRRVSLGHLVTTAVFLATMLLWGARLETRISLVEQASTNADTQRAQLWAGINGRLDRIEGKVDRLIERENGGH